jgi:hypothetical protein
LFDNLGRNISLAGGEASQCKNGLVRNFGLAQNFSRVQKYRLGGLFCFPLPQHLRLLFGLCDTSRSLNLSNRKGQPFGQQSVYDMDMADIDINVPSLSKQLCHIAHDQTGYL